MLPRAYTAHRTRSRTRLRILEKRQDPEYFEAVQERLSALEGVSGVRVNSNTGSVILLHPETSYDDIEVGLQQSDLYELDAGPVPQTSALVRLQTGFTKINQVISQGTAGVADLKTIAVISLVVLAIRQMRQGSLLGPALPLLLSALDIALRFKKEPPSVVPESESPSTPEA